MKTILRLLKNTILLIIFISLTFISLELGYRAYRTIRWKVSFLEPIKTALDARLGWKGKQVFGDLKTNKFKILILGDSYTYGYGIGEENMYYRRIQDALNAELFIYAGYGYGTLQEFIALDMLLDRIKPDLILLQVCHNDFINNSLTLQDASFLNSGILMKRPYLINGAVEYHFPKIMGKKMEFLATHSAIANKLYPVLMKLKAILAEKGLLRSIETDIKEKGAGLEAFSESVALTEELMEKIKERAGTIPVATFSVDDTLPYYAEFKKIFAKTDIDFIERVPREIRQTQDKKIDAKANTLAHWTPWEHHIYGEILARELIRVISVGRGLFVSAIQEPPVLSSRQEINALIDFAKKAYIKTLFIQLYRSNQTWYPSKYADSSPYKMCVKNLSEDPFKLLITQAHAAGIKVYAWLNLLSLGNNKDAWLIKKYGTEILTKNREPKKTLNDYKIDEQYFLEPGDLRVREELSNIVEEVIGFYPELDGILFDYIRYPDKNPAYGYTQPNIKRFQKKSGLTAIDEHNQAWKEWKHNQVTELLELLVKKTHSLNPGIKVSATGCMPYSRAYYEAFQDWPSWLKRGILDSVIIMNYSADPFEFGRWMAAAKEKVGDFKKINIGVGAYKLLRAPDAFKEELRLCEKAGDGDCVIFHYGSLLEDPALGNLLINSAESKVTPLKDQK